MRNFLPFITAAAIVLAAPAAGAASRYDADAELQKALAGRVAGVEAWVAAGIAAGAGFALRAAAIRWHLALPAYRGRR